jgi:hypothetical protein
MATRKEQPSAPEDAAATEAQRVVDTVEDRGFLGVEVDSTPNENYTVAGVLAGKPTPESDLEHARKVRQQLDDDARAR